MMSGHEISELLGQCESVEARALAATVATCPVLHHLGSALLLTNPESFKFFIYGFIYEM